MDALYQIRITLRNDVDLDQSGGGAFERRTIGALTIRSLFWIVVTIVSIRAMKGTPNFGS